MLNPGKRFLCNSCCFFRIITKNLKLALLFLILIMTGFSKEHTLRILALGDSITQGGKRDRKEFTYRLPLQMILHRENIPFDFIGSRSSGLHEDAEWPVVAEGIPFDPDHEGYYGNTTADACRKAMEGYPYYNTPPDIVLVHLGTNDQKKGNYHETVGLPLKEIIHFFRKKNPAVVILLGHLNFNDSQAAFEIREVVNALAKELDTAQSPVRTVNHYENWNEDPKHLYPDTFDWAHPNSKGQEKMAIKWWESLRQFI